MALEAELNTDPTQVVDGLVGAIKTIAADSNYTFLTNIFNEVINLRAKNTELVNSHRNVFEQYWGFRQELEEAQARLEEAKAAVEAELAGKIQELADMTEARTNLDVELTDTKTELAETKAAKEKLDADLATANTELDELCALKASLEAELHQVSAKLEEQKRLSEVAAQEKASLQVALAQCETELDETRSNLETTETRLQGVTKERDDLKVTLCETKTELSAATLRLMELEGYRVVLHDQSENDSIEILDTIWKKLFQLVLEHFRQDLDERVLTDASCWKNLREAEALRGPTQVPIPQSNSLPAKAMRIAAVLSILSRTLHKYIFCPVYLLDDDAELTRLLHDLELENPITEEHIRSTLLATLPEAQRQSAKIRVQSVVRDVAWAVQHLLGALPYDAFCNGLGSACALACTEWKKIQHTRVKIEPYFGPPYDEFDWEALPLPEFEGLRGSPVRSATNSTRATSPVLPINDTGEETSPARVDDAADGKEKEAVDAVELEGKAVDAEKQADTADDAVTVDVPATTGIASETVPMDGETAIDDDDDDDDDSDDDDDEMDPGDILLVAWPSMAIIENGTPQPLTRGLVVTKAQAALAAKEIQMARVESRGSSKRARSMSIPAMPRPSITGSPRSGQAFLATVAVDSEASAAG